MQNKMFLYIVTTIAACIVIYAGFFYGLDYYPLLNNNEGLYAQIPREMLQTSDFIIPSLNGVPYIEKPPLLYWFIALSYKLFGVTEWSARVVTAISGSMLVIVTSLFALVYRGIKSCIVNIVVFATSIGFLVFARMVYFDVLFTLFLSLSFICFYNWFESKVLFWLRLSYVFLAMAVLTKGLTAIILGFIVGISFILLHDNRANLLKSFFDPIGMLLFLLFVVPWHICAAIKDPGFSWFYFINEHLLRFLDLREPRDYYRGNWYYYIPRIILYIFPWCFYVTKIFKLPKRDDNYTVFLWIWLLVTFIFFSISKAKANYYIVVAMPPLILLIVDSMQQMNDLAKIQRYILNGTIALFVCDIIVIKYSVIFPRLTQYMILVPSVSVLSVVGIAVLQCIFAFYGKNNIYKDLLSGALMSVVLVVTAVNIMPKIAYLYSTKRLLQYLPKDEYDNLYMFKDFEKISTVPFYANKVVAIIDSSSNDLLYGKTNHYNNHSFITLQEILALRGKKPIYIIGLKEKLAMFHVKHLVIADRGNTRLIKLIVAQDIVR